MQLRVSQSLWTLFRLEQDFLYLHFATANILEGLCVNVHLCTQPSEEEGTEASGEVLKRVPLILTKLKS